MAPSAQAVQLMNIVPLLFIFLIFYFMIIRPQKLKDKEHRKMVDSLAKNDDVITTGGIHGVVISTKDKSVIIRIDDNVKIEVEKNCIVFVKKKTTAIEGA